MKRRIFLAMTALMAAAFFMKRLLLGKRADPAWAFRQRVLERVRVDFPELPVDAPAYDPTVVTVNGIQVGLQNLRAKFELTDKSEKAFRDIVQEHFNLAIKEQPVVASFEAAQPMLRPQIMPAEYASRGDLIAFPFGRTVALGVVVDTDGRYFYVSHDHAKRWEKTDAALLEQALSNLNNATRNLQLQAAETDEANWVAVELKDGYDAARIAIPEFRKFIEGRLGPRFLFAIPNRDFLICWNRDASPSFLAKAAANARDDYEREPYPLSPNIFELTEGGQIVERG